MTIRFLSFPVCQVLQSKLNREYESCETLGAVYNQLSDLIGFIENYEEPDRSLLFRTYQAQSHILEAIKLLDPKLIPTLEANDKQHQEKLAIDCMRY